MKKSNTAFLTTVFPASKRYLDDFFISLQKQTIKDFDVIVINDGIEDLQTYKIRYSDLNIIEEKASSSPARNREAGIKVVIKLGYRFLVFGDSDDFFSENRIEETIKALKRNHVVVNELTLFNKNSEEKNFLKTHLKNTKILQDNIFNGNIFGFSNIGLRTEIINPKFKFDTNLIAVDWFFITTLLLQEKCQVQFLNDVVTHYRQHSDNIIGMSKFLTDKKLEIGIKVKKKHYSALIKYFQYNNLQELSLIFGGKLSQLYELESELQNLSFKNKYIEVVNSNFENIFTGWWSEIITLDNYHKYENTD